MAYCIMALVVLSSLARSCIELPPGTDTDTATARDPRLVLVDEAVEADLAENAATAASVAVWLDGEIIWVGGYGTMLPGDTVPPNEETLFMIGSNTKKVTAISLLKKVESGQLTMDTPIAEVLPDLEMQQAPEFVDATVHQLLTHQGGIVDWSEYTTATTDSALRDYSYGEFSETYYSLLPPGVFFNYSNSNYSLAGLIDETLDHRMWPDIVTEDIFLPLGMNRTVARRSQVDENVCLGVSHLSGNGELVSGPGSLEQTWESAFTRPAGMVWSTPSDEMRMARFLVEGNNDVLDDTLLTRLTSPQTPIHPDNIAPESSYGYGLVIQQGITLGDDWYDIPVWAHGGDTLTHSSMLLILPEQKFAISIVSNSGSDAFTQTVQTAIEALVPLPSPTTMPAPEFDATALDDLTGTYVDTHLYGEVTATRVGDALEVSVPMLDMMGIPYEPMLTPLSTHVWMMLAAGEPKVLTFVKGPDGIQYVFDQDFAAQRIDDGVASAETSGNRI